MSGYTWAAIGMITAGAAALAADHYLGDRIRHAIEIRRFRRDIERHEQVETLVALVQAEIAEAEQRLRDCYGDGDGDDTP